MADEDRYKVPLFDGTNYSNWKFRMETLLEEHELIEFIEKSVNLMIEIKSTDTAEQRMQKEAELKTLKKSDRKCKSLIVQRIADNHLEYIKDEETAYGIWIVLKDTFERKGIASQLRIRKKLLTMKYESTETMSAHFLNFGRLIRELKSTGAMIEEVDVVCHLLLTLPSEYDAVVTALETLLTEQLKLSFVKNRLLDEEAKRSNVLDNDNKRVAFATSKNSKGSNSKFKGKNKAKFTFQCHNCGKYGHKRADCRKPQKDNKGESGSANLTTENSKKKSSAEEEFAFNVEAEINGEIVIWFLDSGATEHLARSSERLENLRALKSPIQINVAKSGQKLTAMECGDFKVRK